MAGSRVARRVMRHAPDRAKPVTIQPVPMSFWLIERPMLTEPRPAADEIDIEGWIASPHPVEHLTIVGVERWPNVELVTRPRPEVNAAYGLPALGFRITATPTKHSPDLMTIRYSSLDPTHDIHVLLSAVDDAVAGRRAAKRQRLRAVLRCPRCGTAGSFDEGRLGLRCRRCRHVVESVNHALNFLDAETRAAFGIIDTNNVSSNYYDGVTLNLIAELRDGLILDCGAGSQANYYPNVVNLDVVAYDSTDILAVGERLPFADHSFDAVISFAVLEHVLDPSACAAEIQRVLKPGGTLYCQAPFLVPVHAYPNHYFNMTSQGLRSLFPELDIHHVGSFPFGQPIFMLSWFLNEYVASLPEGPTRAAFESMSVRELAGAPSTLMGQPFVVDVDARARDVLACGNYILATKPA